MQPKYKLTLYVTPDSSGKALAHLYRALEDLAYNDYELEIVDVLDQPDRAVKAKVIGTPALVYDSTDGPKFFYSLSDVASVRQMLGILSS